MTHDPPFSRLDLVSCCNVLICLGPVLQRKVLSTIHYALKSTGFLVLGSSESIGTLSESFHQVEKTHEIYRMRAEASTPALPLSEDRQTAGRVELRERIAEERAGLDLQREVDRLVLAEHAPRAPVTAWLAAAISRLTSPVPPPNCHTTPLRCTSYLVYGRSCT